MFALEFVFCGLYRWLAIEILLEKAVNNQVRVTANR
jgi:hypothetical protein